MKRRSSSWQLSTEKFALWIGIGLALLGAAQAQDSVKSFFELDQLGDVPGVVEVSTDYLTVIEFEGHTVEDLRSARPDLFTIESSENIVTIRANKDNVSTDVVVRAGGRTAIFTLQSNAQATRSRSYVVRDTPAPERSIRGSSGVSGAARPVRAEEAPLFPQGLLFETEFFRPRQSEIVIQYRLINDSQNPIVNEPSRLRVYYGDTSILYEIERSPAPGRPNFLAPGEAEFGQLVIPQAPVDLGALELEWSLIEVGPGTEHILIRNFAELAEQGISAIGQLPTPLEEAAAPVTDEAASPDPSAASTESDTSETEATEAEESEGAEAVEDEPVEAQLEEEQPPEAEAAPQNERIVTEASSAEAPTVDTTFDEGDEDWYTWSAETAEANPQLENGEYCVDVTVSGDLPFHVGFHSKGLELETGQTYRLAFEAYADKPINVDYSLGRSADPWTDYAGTRATLETQKTAYEQTFTLEREDELPVRINYYLGRSDDMNEGPYRVCFDSIELSKAAEAPEAQANQDDIVWLTGKTVQTDVMPANNLVVDGDFASDSELWSLALDEESTADVEAGIEEGRYCVNVLASGEENNQVRLYHSLPDLPPGEYRLRFDASSSADVTLGLWAREIEGAVYLEAGAQLNPEPQSFNVSFNQNASETRSSQLIFNFVLDSNLGELPYWMCIDNVQVAPNTPELADAQAEAPTANETQEVETLISDTFEEEQDFWVFDASQGAEASKEVVEGEYCVTINEPGDEVWKVALRAFEIPLQAGKTYEVGWSTRSERPVILRTAFSMAREPWTGYAAWEVPVGSAKTLSRETFTAEVDDEAARLEFLMGGDYSAGDLPVRVCLDDIEVAAVDGD